jgi:hypothetical protein
MARATISAATPRRRRPRPSSVQGAATPFPGGAQKLGLERHIDDFREPHLASQQGWIERHTWVARHSRRRSMDHAVGPLDHCGDVIGGREDPLRKSPCHPLRKQLCARFVAVDDEQARRTRSEDRIRYGRPGAAGPDQDNVLSGDVSEFLAERDEESRAVRVEPLALAVAEHHRIDCVDGTGFIGKLLEERQHGLLARIRDVESVESRGFGRFDQPRQIGDALPALCEVDELIVKRESLAPGFLLVQRGRARSLDSFADQTDQELGLRLEARYRSTHTSALVFSLFHFSSAGIRGSGAGQSAGPECALFGSIRDDAARIW